MPIYKYKCKNCDYIFKQLYLTFKEGKAREAKCPKCGSTAERFFSSAPTRIIERFPEDSEKYREMHYYEKKKNWEKAARAAEGISEFARDKFLAKAKKSE